MFVSGPSSGSIWRDAVNEPLLLSCVDADEPERAGEEAFAGAPALLAERAGSPVEEQAALGQTAGTPRGLADLTPQSNAP